MTAQISTGLAITFFSGFFAEILDVEPPQGSREPVNSSHMGTVKAHTFIPKTLVDWGEMRVQIHFDPATDPPIDEAAETITITFSDGSVWSFEGFMTNYAPQAPLEDKMVANCTIKVSGNITIDGVSI